MNEASDNQLRDFYAVAILGAGILICGVFILWMILKKDETTDGRVTSRNYWAEPLGDYTLQILGLTFLLPTILVIAVATKLNAEAVTALLGAISGYIFGSARRTDPTPADQSSPQRTPSPPRPLQDSAAAETLND
jgi:hypothetical protein